MRVYDNAAAVKIIKILNDFLEPFDCTATLSNTFCYWLDKNLIEVSLAVTDDDKDSFLENAKKRFPRINADIFLWSFLHELGHHETEDDFENEEWEYYRARTEEEISPEEYYNLPQEFEATQWAGEYMMENIAVVAELWKKLVPAIIEYYKSERILSIE